MKEIGNLAIVCAKRKDVLMQILDGTVTIHIGHGPDKETLTAAWHDDAKIHEFVMEINHGRFKETALGGAI